MLAVLLSSVLAIAPPGDGPFQTAAVAPPDVRLLLRVRGGAELRAQPSMAAAHAALERLAGDRILTMAWSRMSEQVAVEGGALFDSLLGADATYMERTREGAVEWAVVTRVGQPAYDTLVERLKPAMQGGGRVVFGAQGLVAAWRPPNLVVGPATHAALFDQVVANVDAAAPAPPAPPQPCLLGDPEVMLAAQWPAARMEFILRSEGDHPGITVATVTPANSALSVRHRSRFPRPIIHVSPGAPADAGLLAPFVGDSLAVFAMNPWRGDLDPAEPVDALLLEGRLDDAMRANMGARQLLVVGERAAAGSGMRTPSLGLAFEVRDPVLAEAQWDGWARRLVTQLAVRVQKPAPELPVTPTGKPRQAGMEPLFREVMADHPLARGMDLCWMTLSTPNGAWQLLATDRELLDRVASRIGGAVRAPAPDQWHEVGSVRGTAVSDHLRSWATEARAFRPDMPEAFTTGLMMAADLASVAEQVEWRARAPEEQVIESEMVLHLRRPEAPAAAQPAAPAAAPPPAPPAAPTPPAPPPAPGAAK